MTNQGMTDEAYPDTRTDTAAIKAVTDNLPDSGALTSISDETDKIDEAATDGLNGVHNSLSYRVHEIEKHFHSPETWRGMKAVQGATDWFDDVLTPFQAISGNNTYGADANDEAQVIGSGDTPVRAGMAYFDLHRLFIDDVSQDTPYKLRIVYGTGTMADAITAGQYSEVIVASDTTNPQQSSGTPVDVMMPRVAAGVKVWIQAWNVTDNATIDFYVGFHEYIG